MQLFTALGLPAGISCNVIKVDCSNNDVHVVCFARCFRNREQLGILMSRLTMTPFPPPTVACGAASRLSGSGNRSRLRSPQLRTVPAAVDRNSGTDGLDQSVFRKGRLRPRGACGSESPSARSAFRHLWSLYTSGIRCWYFNRIESK